MKEKKIKVMSIFGTRPELIKLFPVINILNNDPSFESIVLSTAQHREMIDDLLEIFSLNPNYDLNIIQKNQTLVDLTKNIMMKIDGLYKSTSPDLVLVQGDTTTAAISSLTAFYSQLKVGHVEAGLRSFNKMHPFPEEINRKMISVLADLHFAPTEVGAKNLINEGVDKNDVFITGNTVIDTLLFILKNRSPALSDYVPEKALKYDRLILVTAHRRESFGTPFIEFCNCLKKIADRNKNIALIYPVHLNPNVRGPVFDILNHVSNIFLIDPVPYPSFIHLMKKASLIITDSGGIQEEAPTFNVPVLIYRKFTERPEGLKLKYIKLVGQNSKILYEEAIKVLDDKDETYARNSKNPYGDGNASMRIVQAIKYHFFNEKRPENFT